MSGPSEEVEGGRVVVVGSLNADLVVRCRRRPEPGETVLGSGLERRAGGKGANQAAAAVAAGASTQLVGRVGSDAEGRTLLEQLAREGVGLDWIATAPEAPTGLALITVDDAGENSIVVIAGANAELGEPDVDRAAGDVTRADVLLMQLEVPPEPLIRAAGLAAERCRVVVNASPVRPLEDDLLRRCDPLVVNLGEAAALLGADAPLDAMPERLLELGVRSAVVTAGEQGARYADSGRRLTARAPQVEVIDTTGAGDAFAGALAAALARREPLQQALDAAVAAGARAVSHEGARPAPNA